MPNNFYSPGGFGRFSFFPPVIKNLLITNAAVFFLMTFMKTFTVGHISAYVVLMKYFALIPLGEGFQFWQLVTYQFLHGSFSHILFNMFSLWMFGMEIEQVWGSKKFLIFYLLCGVGGGLAQLLLNSSGAPTIGASGAIFGVMIAFALLFPDRLIYFYFFIPVKAKYLITGMLLINIFALGDESGGIAYLAHVGGAITGLIYMLADKDIHFSLSNFIGYGKPQAPPSPPPASHSEYEWGRQSGSSQNSESFVSKNTTTTPDQEYYGGEITQDEIDAILDKISRSGYKNLSQREKRVLFEASKRMK